MKWDFILFVVVAGGALLFVFKDKLNLGALWERFEEWVNGLEVPDDPMEPPVEE